MTPPRQPAQESRLLEGFHVLCTPAGGELVGEQVMRGLASGPWPSWEQMEADKTHKISILSPHLSAYASCKSINSVLDRI